MTRDAPISAAGRQRIALWLGKDEICASGYTLLRNVPEIMAGVQAISDMIACTELCVMQRGADGAVRVDTPLAQLLDSAPYRQMTRYLWMSAIVQTLLLHGGGNAILMPHTQGGRLTDIEPISASRVTYLPQGYSEYSVLIDGIPHDPSELVHIAYNPDQTYLWRGRGVNVTLRQVADTLTQAAATQNAFLKSEYKPSLIVRVDALTETLRTPEGRQKLIEEYIKPQDVGAPWIIPSDLMDVKEVRPLTLADLAISDSVKLSRRSVASLLGCPAYLLGEGNYNAAEWNTFISTKIRAIMTAIEQGLSKAVIEDSSQYITFDWWSLMQYDHDQVSRALLSGARQGFVNGDEWRKYMHLPPAGLTEYTALENYIPVDMAGNQEKLK